MTIHTALLVFVTFSSVIAAGAAVIAARATRGLKASVDENKTAIEKLKNDLNHHVRECRIGRDDTRFGW